MQQTSRRCSRRTSGDYRVNNDSPQYELKLEGYTGSRTPAAPAEAPVEDGGYLIGNQQQADLVEQIKALPNESVQELQQAARRRIVLGMAEVMYKAESGSIVRAAAFDKGDVSCQRFIRMAEAAFEYMLR
jgi:hypothetical protein